MGRDGRPRSQGKSVDEVIISADGMTRELFYVAASRGRQRITVVTSAADTLRASVARTAARQSATELARKALVGLRRGFRRGLAAGADMIRHARLWSEPDLHYGFEPPARGRQTHEHGISR